MLWKGGLPAAGLALFAFAHTAAAGGGGTFGPKKNSVEVGVFLGGFLPSEKQEFYDPAVASQTPLESVNFEVGLRFGYFPHGLIGIEAEGFAIPARTEEEGDWVPILGVRAHLVGQLPGRVTPFVLVGLGIGHMSSDDTVLGTDTDALFHLGAGVKLYAWKSVALRLDLRYLRGPAAREDDAGTNHFEVLFGVSKVPSRKKKATPQRDDDPDDDGIRGEDDECPEEAGEPPDGCPVEEEKDADGDGIADDEDECPKQAENVNGWEDSDGCPDEIPDSDGDGRNDLEDECRDRAEDEDGFEDEDGCPDPDNDGDGLADGNDQCPDESGPLARKGCPRKAPRPRPPRVTPAVAEGQIIKTIYFRRGQARIQGSMRRPARRAARHLRRHPEITKVRVEGHADDEGTPERNMELSRERAEAVVQRLLDKGVSADRIEAVWFGEDRPLEDNTTSRGREANRRVEIRIVSD